MDSLYHHGVKGMKWGVRRVKKDSIVQRVTDNKNESNSGRTYISFKKLDNMKYIDTAGEGIHMTYTAEAPNGYKVKLKVTNDILYPSYKKTMDSFVKTIGNSSIDKVTEGMTNDNAKKFISGMKDKSIEEVINDSYSIYSRSLMNSDYNRKQFFGQLKSEGYNAVVDQNDASFADTPLIIFEKGNNLKQISATPISDKDKFIAYKTIRR